MVEKENIYDKLARASEVYGNQTIIRAGINAIPFVGSSLDVLLFSSGQKYVQRRIEAFIEELSKQISLLDESKINKGFLETEEAFDLIIRTFNSVAKTRQAEKIKLFAKIVKNSFQYIKLDYENIEIYLRIVDELTANELSIAMIIFKDIKDRKEGNYRELKNRTAAFILAEKYTNYSVTELSYVLMRLAKSGLLEQFPTPSLGSDSPRYAITKLFEDFINFVENDKSPQN